MSTDVPENAVGGVLHIEPITGAIGNQLTADTSIVEAQPRTVHDGRKRLLTKARSDYNIRDRLHPSESKAQHYGKRKTTYAAYRAGQPSFRTLARRFNIQKAHFDLLPETTRVKVLDSSNAFSDIYNGIEAFARQKKVLSLEDVSKSVNPDQSTIQDSIHVIRAPADKLLDVCNEVAFVDKINRDYPWQQPPDANHLQTLYLTRLHENQIRGVSDHPSYFDATQYQAANLFGN